MLQQVLEDDISILSEPDEAVSLDESSRCQIIPEFVLSTTRHDICPASVHVLRAAYTDLKKRFNELQQKYKMLKHLQSSDRNEMPKSEPGCSSDTTVIKEASAKQRTDAEIKGLKMKCLYFESKYKELLMEKNAMVMAFELEKKGHREEIHKLQFRILELQESLEKTKEQVKRNMSDSSSFQVPSQQYEPSKSSIKTFDEAFKDLMQEINDLEKTVHYQKDVIKKLMGKKDTAHPGKRPSGMQNEERSLFSKKETDVTAAAAIRFSRIVNPEGIETNENYSDVSSVGKRKIAQENNISSSEDYSNSQDHMLEYEPTIKVCPFCNKCFSAFEPQKIFEHHVEEHFNT